MLLRKNCTTENSDDALMKLKRAEHTINTNPLYGKLTTIV